jgi:hypothetical protein
MVDLQASTKQYVSGDQHKQKNGVGTKRKKKGKKQILQNLNL